MARTKSQQWLRAHYSTIGGSSAGAAAGRGRFTSRRELVSRMIAARKGEHIEPLPETDDMRRGSLLEPVAIHLLGEAIGAAIRPWDQESFCASPDRPWAHSLPDGILDDGRVLNEIVEVKVPRPATVVRVRQNGLFPEWVDQCQHGLAVTDAYSCHLGILDPVTCRIDHHEIIRDEDHIEALMALERETWQMVLAGELPHEEPTALEDAIEPGLVVFSDERIERLARNFALMRRMADEAADVLEDAAAQLLAAVGCERVGDKWRGGPEAFEVPGILRIVHKPQPGARRFDAAAAKRDFPALAVNRYMTQNAPSRPLRVRLLERVDD